MSLLFLILGLLILFLLFVAVLDSIQLAFKRIVYLSCKFDTSFMLLSVFTIFTILNFTFLVLFLFIFLLLVLLLILLLRNLFLDLFLEMSRLHCSTKPIRCVKFDWPIQTIIFYKFLLIGLLIELHNQFRPIFLSLLHFFEVVHHSYN